MNREEVDHGCSQEKGEEVDIEKEKGKEGRRAEEEKEREAIQFEEEAVSEKEEGGCQEKISAAEKICTPEKERGEQGSPVQICDDACGTEACGTQAGTTQEGCASAITKAGNYPGARESGTTSAASISTIVSAHT